MKKLVLVTGILASFALLPAAEAGTRSPGVNKRQHNQHHRIVDGVKSGELTRGEVRELRGEQRAIRIKKRAYKSDGDLSRSERKELHQDLNAASRNIHDEKHDDDVRN